MFMDKVMYSSFIPVVFSQVLRLFGSPYNKSSGEKKRQVDKLTGQIRTTGDQMKPIVPVSKMKILVR